MPAGPLGPTRPLEVVTAAGDTPLGARLLAAASRAAGGFVVLAGGGDPPAGRLAGLLGGGHGIGVVVPTGDPPPAGGAPATGDIDPAGAAAAGAMAATARLVAVSGVDPTEDDPARVTAAVAAAAARAGLRVVADTAWTGTAWTGTAWTGTAGTGTSGTEPARGGVAAGPASGPTDDGVRVLVVTAPLPAETARLADRAVAALIGSLARLVGPRRLTVMTTERTPAGDRRRWADAGVEVLEGPAAWTAGAGGPGRLYSHVIVTAAAARSSVRDWVAQAQPQAARVLYLPSLDFRDVVRLAPVSPPDETAGLETVRLDTAEQQAQAVRWAHHVWCQWPEDSAVVRGWSPRGPVVEIPPVMDPAGDAPGPAGREGVLLVAAEGHDVLGGHEDAALRFLRRVAGPVAARHPSSWTVVADRPTPMLVQACAERGARIVGEADLAAAMAGARVLVAAHGYGAGQPAVLMAAVEAGLPVVCTPSAVGDLDLGQLAAAAVAAGDEDLATRTCQLLADTAHWHHVRDLGRQLAAERYPAAGHRSALSAALARMGVLPEEDGPGALPPAAGPAPGRRPFRNPRLAIRPEGIGAPGPLPAHVPTEERDRYRLWVQRRGPSPEVLDAIAAELGRLSYRPLISVLMPVHNTDPDVLQAAIESVRAQIYDRWQLCVVDDGSVRPETRAVLDGIAGHPNIVVVRHDAAGGISVATNAALAAAEGDYVTFLDHDDELKPHALAQVVRWLDADPSIDVLYTDEDKLDPAGGLYDPHIKPDWAPDQLTAHNYVCHLTVARRSLVEELGGLRRDYDGSQDYDLVLRLTERTDRIAHIPEPLYSWRAVPGSAAASADAKPYALEAARRAVADALRRRGYGDRVDRTRRRGFHRPRYPLPGTPKVSIIIPTRNGRALLETCIGSILESSTYRNYEIVIVDNHSTDGATLEYLGLGPWRVIRYPHPFNYARMMNLAARSVDCDALLFLNNDTEVITADWIESLLEHAMRPEVGAVGGRLYFGDGTPQHEGIMTGIGGWAHSANHKGYWARGELTRNVSAVTGACTMMRPSVFWRVGGNDERLRVAYNDVDLCLRVRQAGYQVVYTPYVELYHYESSTRGRFEHRDDGPLYGERWRVRESVDPYYSPMFEDFPPFLIRL